jgi:hypothetical protein
MQAYTLELPLIFASADAPRTATLEYDSTCHGLKLTLHSLLPDGSWTAKTYAYMPKYVSFNESSLSKVLADYFVWRATQTHPEQLSAKANPDLTRYFAHYTGFRFDITKVEPFTAANEWEAYECLQPSALFDVVRVTFAYEWRTEERTRSGTEELKFFAMR